MADKFIPNDVVVGGLAEDAHRPLVLITGPNMGGKSTLMRQTALICLLAQLVGDAWCCCTVRQHQQISLSINHQTVLHLKSLCVVVFTPVPQN